MRRWLILVLPVALLAAVWLVMRPGESAAVAPAPEPLLEAGIASEALVSVEDAGRSSADSGALDAELETNDVAPEPIESAEPEPSAMLIVRALLPDGTPWKEGRVQVTAKSSLSRLEFGRDERSAQSSTFNIRSTGPRGDTALSGLDERGEVRMHSAEAMTLDLRLVDALGCIGAEATDVALVPGEQRTLELWTDRFPMPLLGRCVDEQGRPVVGANVDVHDPDADPLLVRTFVRRTTNEAGEFDTPPLFIAHVNVNASLEHRISAERFDVPVGGAALEIVLRSGRRLVVEMRDDHGEPFSDVWLSVHEQGGEGPLEVQSEPCDEGRLYTALPDRPLELRWGLPCAPETMPVDIGVERVRVPVRRPGTLAIEVGPLPGDTNTKYEAGLYCLDGTTQVWPPKTVLNTGHQQAEWIVAPGRYVLQLLHLPEHAPEAWAPWGAPIEVEVRSGETTFERVGGQGNSARTRD